MPAQKLRCPYLPAPQCPPPNPSALPLQLLANGTNDNGSGVVALLELARMWSQAYDSARSQGEHNLLFVLTAAGRLDYWATDKWLTNADPRLKRTIQFALCLDQLGAGPALRLHVSKPPKRRSEVRRLARERDRHVRRVLVLGVIRVVRVPPDLPQDTREQKDC